QRDTSNSFTLNAVNANNIFNGKSSSYVSANRFVLNTGENFLAGGQIQTNTSVYDAIGQGLPTPPQEAIEELHVNTSMYDASQGANSGAHIEVTTKSGTNALHGQAWEYHQTNAWDATPFFLKGTGVAKYAPPLHRNVFGGQLGGPIRKDKLFFFGSYQGQRVTDAFNGATDIANVPPGLTNDRSTAALVALAGLPPGSPVDPVALFLFQGKTKTGQFLIPSQNIFDPNRIQVLGGNAFEQGPPSTFTADQVNGNIDYNFSEKDRLAGKYYFQRNPSTSPFAVSSTPGFPQSLTAGSQVFSLDNTTTLTSNTTWEQRLGFIREIASAHTSQSLTPQDIGINLVGGKFFPGFTLTNPAGTGHDLGIGPSTNFANAGAFQNQWEGASNLSWVHGRHSFGFGLNWDYAQLNIKNKENNVASFTFNDFAHFLQGNLGSTGRNSGLILSGETNRYFRSNQTGVYAQDNIKLKSNLTLNVGLRWDWDGPLWEKYGRLTNFYTQDYSFNLATDAINNIGLVVAGNNKAFGTKGVSNSTLTGRQWIFEPRVGLAWSPSFFKNVVVRAGFGLYADRGEFFTEFSPSAGLGISGPFGVTAEEPFTIPVSNTCTGVQCLANNPFGTGPLPLPPNNLSGVAALVHNLSGLSGCAEPVTPTCTPTGTPLFAFLFGGYDPRNTLPYSENWSLDLQWQPYNTLVLTAAYVGNHGLHEVLPIPFNQPGIATPQHPIHNQIYSYGYQAVDSTSSGCSGNNPSCPLLTEQVQTTIGAFTASDGNTALRTPFVGYNPNSNFWKAEGISHYNALQLGVNKRLSHGLQVNGSYTWSRTLDEQSGLGLFYNGNDPLNPRSGYGPADFDRTHVLTISYLYQFPSISNASGFLKYLVNGWGFSGITVAESGQPFLVYDFSGSVAGIFFSADDFITNPILPIASGKTASQVQTQSTMGVNAGKPYYDPNAFSIPLLQPGQDGVPPCGLTTGGTTVCDNFETGFGTNGRNVFRAPFQTRFDFAVHKDFKITERFDLKYEAQIFNIFNHPSFDAPNNNVTLNGCFNPIPCYSTRPPANQGIGFIQHTLGSPRFIQMALHLTF
ncbi:MAG: TonB-dependent receptor, partial [Candidatus Acidiferrales bacterium]